MSERAPSGTARMEARSEELLQQERFNRAIESRAVSAEVSELNDIAQFEIFGSTVEGERKVAHDTYKEVKAHGDVQTTEVKRTHTFEPFETGYTVVDRESGEVIATPERPMEGIIDKMRHNPRFGTKEEDRNAAADKYKKDVIGLTENGFELCQAKMIMDLRGKDLEVGAKLMAQYIASGMDPREAQKKAKETCARADAARLRIIKEGGAFTMDEYDRLRKGEKLYDDDGNFIDTSAARRVRDRSVDGGHDDDGDGSDGGDGGRGSDGGSADDGHDDDDDDGVSRAADDPRSPEEIRRDAIRDARRLTEEEALDDWYEIENSDYARLSSIRERTSFRAARNPRGRRAVPNVAPRTKVTHEMVEESRDRLEQIRRNTNDALRQRLIDAGATPQEVNGILRDNDAMYVRTIAQQQNLYRSALADFSREGKLGGLRGRFYDWWARQGGGGDHFYSKGRLKGTVKKAVVMGAFGVPAGIVGTAVAPVLGAGLGVVGGLFAARAAVGVAKGLASSHMEKHAAATVANAQATRRAREAAAHIFDAYASSTDHEAIEAERVVDGPRTFTDSFAEGTRREVRRNRARVVKAVGTAALGAGAAVGLSIVGEHIFGGASAAAHHNASHHSGANKGDDHSGASHPKGGANKGGAANGSNNGPASGANNTAPGSANAELTPSDQPFTVNSGDGIINEISRYATEHGHAVSSQKAFEMYQQLAAEHGKNIIQMNGGGSSEYLISPGDWGISHPGVGHWYPGIESELDNMLNKSSN